MKIDEHLFDEMTVITREMTGSGVGKRDLLPLSYFKKKPYTGSKGSLRYKLEKYEPPVVDDSGDAGGDAAPKSEAKGEPLLRCYTWTTPYAFDKTPAQEITITDFPFSSEGIEQARALLDTMAEQTVKK